MSPSLYAVGLSASPGGTSSRSGALLDVTLSLLAERGARVERYDLAALPSDGLLGRDRSPQVDAALSAVGRAHLLAVATPIYRATYTGLLKVFFDLLPTAAFPARSRSRWRRAGARAISSRSITACARCSPASARRRRHRRVRDAGAVQRRSARPHVGRAARARGSRSHRARRAVVARDAVRLSPHRAHHPRKVGSPCPFIPTDPSRSTTSIRTGSGRCSRSSSDDTFRTRGSTPRTIATSRVLRARRTRCSSTA